MKRFYTVAARELDVDGGRWRMTLDGRPVRTPARDLLAVPGVALADAITAEWDGQGESIDPATMPMTGFANACIDRILPAVETFVRNIAAYGASDLLCYRAEAPPELVAEQAGSWDPLLDWARGRYGISFTVTGGIMPVDQPAATVARLGEAVAALDPWLLAGLSNLVSIGGTLVGALALIEGAVDAESLWHATRVDEDWQERRWGDDQEAMTRDAARHVQFLDAARYCALVLRGD